MKKPEPKKKRKTFVIGLEFNCGRTAHFTGPKNVVGCFLDLISYGLRPQKIEGRKK